MSITAKDIYKVQDKIDEHARAIISLQTELRAMLAQISFPKYIEWPCPRCGVDAGGERALAFHIQNAHGGPVVPMTEAELAAE